MDKMHLRVVILTTGEKNSAKSTPSFWISPLTTSLAFNLSIFSSDFCLILLTHLQGRAFFPGDRTTNFQILLDFKTANSIAMACYQPGCITTCAKLIGSWIAIAKLVTCWLTGERDGKE